MGVVVVVHGPGKWLNACAPVGCISDDVYVDMIVAKLNDVFAEEMAEVGAQGS